ncbi:MAG: c-type cytochrome [Alphaproteobacteria bacterium]|nr:c-type cytochrome [Alphaproteobacteria bacterium]
MRTLALILAALGLSLVAHTSLLFARAPDADRGARLYDSRCVGCHSLDTNRIGPRHGDVFGRTAGSVADYDYSAALKRSEIVWREDTLDAWLRNPEDLVPGQKMNFRVSSAADRGDLIAFLKRAAQD